jgi:putative hydrolase of the HAD superfamily
VTTPKVILFDLDDTLAERKSTLKCFATQYLEDFPAHLEVDENTFALELERSDGHGYRPRLEMFQILLEILPWKIKPTPENFLTYWINTFPRLALPMPGMLETLQTLKARGVKLGIVTNGHSFQQQSKIDALEIRDFLIVCWFLPRSTLKNLMCGFISLYSRNYRLKLTKPGWLATMCKTMFWALEMRA